MVQPLHHVAQVVVELGAEDLMELAGAPAASNTAQGEAWLARNWLYFYRNTRQLTETMRLDELADLQVDS